MTEAVPLPTTGPVRCSDADRARISERLRVASGEGRLTMAELADRLTDVYAARYGLELDALVADLPATTEPAAAGWRAVPAVARLQLGADLAVSARRRWVVAVLSILLMAGFAILSAHAFGREGFGHHGFGGPWRH